MMVELQPVVFAFNQKEYQVFTSTTTDKTTIFRLPGIDTVVKVMLAEETFGIQSIETVPVEQRRGYKIVDAKEITGNLCFRSQLPIMHCYEVRLRDGRVVPAELCLESWGARYWKQPCLNQRIADQDVVGWRISKTIYS